MEITPAMAVSPLFRGIPTEELNALFPEAGVVRMDADTTSGKDAHARLLHE